MIVFTFLSRPRSFARLALALCVALVASAPGIARQAAPAPPSPPAPAPPANLIQIDVHALQGGAPVSDLTASDFEVLEDDAPQKIDSFERVDLQPTGAPASRQPSASVTLAKDGGQSPSARLFVVFLDSYFTDFAGSPDLRRAFVDYLDRLISPNDLVGVVTADMTPSTMVLMHRTGSIDSMLSRYWVWGHPGATTLDPIEQEYLQCYPAHAESDRSDQAFGAEMVERRREKAVLDALTALTQHLQTVGAGRKAVIMVTDGWLLFTPNMSMTDRNVPSSGRGNFRRRGQAPTDAGDQGGGITSERCQHDRVSLALVDDKAAFDDLATAANRATVSFYPMTVEGLAGSGRSEALRTDRERPEDIGEFHPADGESARRRRIDSVQSLASGTDGFAVASTNDLDPSLTRIRQDVSSYYLLGYTSTNPRADGKFRKIEVRVKRPGVEVRTRTGYRAPTVEDVLRARGGDSQTTATTKSPIAVALAELKADRPSAPVHISAAYAPLGGVAGGARAHVWALAEIDPEVARHGEWIGGGTIDLTLTARDGETLAAKTVTLAGGERAAAADLGEVTAVAGDAVVHATAKAAGGGRQNYAEALRLEALGAGGRPLMYRRGPETGTRYVPTASHDFERTDRLRLDLPLASAPASASAELLDRDGRKMAIPVTVATRVEQGIAWLSADVPLAPLAAGTYLVRLEPDPSKPETHVVTGFRVVP